MSRLLFAAARGARVQTWVGALEWREEFRVAISNADQYWVRIHPDDEHLQYGPISTALRERAGDKRPPKEDFMYDVMAGIVPNYIEGDWAAKYENLLHRSLFLLILAEALADSGL